jgi:NAD+ kinase
MNTVPLPTLVGDDFVLRPFRPSDAASLQKAMNDERITRKVTHIPFPYTLEHAEAWLRNAGDIVTPESRRIDFAIVRHVDGEDMAIGSVAFMNRESHKAQLSYWIRPDQWGKGIVPASVKLLVQFGFEKIGLERIYAYVYNANRASARVLQKCGFHYEGTHEKEWKRTIDGNDVLFDSNYYSIVRKTKPKRFALRFGRPELHLRQCEIGRALEVHGAAIVTDVAEATADIAVAIGGDGTVMRSIAEFSAVGIPTIGINGGDVGFLTVGDADHINTILARVCAGEHSIERRLGLELVHRGNPIGPIVNDVVLRHPSSVARYSVCIDGVQMYKPILADGIIVSTPTGSTAYSLSLGGPIVDPRSRDVGVSFMAPMRVNARRHMCSALAHGGEIVITIDSSKEAHQIGLTADSHKMELGMGESITIRASTVPLLVATFGMESYVRALQTKLGFV